MTTSPVHTGFVAIFYYISIYNVRYMPYSVMIIVK